MKKLLDSEQARIIQEEIRSRVFEKYAEVQGVETQKHELKATLEALHEVTHIPLEEIEKIASEVIQQYGASSSLEPIPREKLRHLIPPKDMTFEKVRRRIEKNKQGFAIHLLAYVCINIPLIFLNMITTWFPWAMFPLLGWGIGLGSHFLVKVYWPNKDIREKIQMFKSQLHQILEENVPQYRTESQSRIFNGIYRLLVAEGSKESVKEYMQNIDPQLPEHEVNQITTQLCVIRDKYVKQ
jgi:hypothetical protein